MNYGSGGVVTATGGGYRENTRTAGKKGRQEIPWLKIMIAAVAIVILGIAYLVLTGYPVR
jgi:hypothetical protein